MTSDIFHPLIRQWFDDQFESPTDIQSRAWPVIAGREHVLITAPTGSGKTLTAFLWSINRFVTGDLEPGGLHHLADGHAQELHRRAHVEALDGLVEVRVPNDEVAPQTVDSDPGGSAENNRDARDDEQTQLPVVGGGTHDQAERAWRLKNWRTRESVL